VKPTTFLLAATCILTFIGGCASERPILYRINTHYTVADPQFAQTMGNLMGPAIEGGNAVQTLLNGDQIFPAMLDAIRSAKKTITLETYIYWSGTIGQEFTDALSERAHAGLKVHVLVDSIGSSRIDRNFIKQMRAAGAKVQEYHAFHIFDPATWRQIDNRTHRKILVTDGTLGFTGGVGIADEWRGHADRSNHWRDSHYLVKGPVVGQLQAVFADNWMQTTGVVIAGDEYFPKLEAGGSIHAQMCKSSSTGGSENMQLMFLLSVAAAGKTLRLESAYFDPDSLTRKTLIAAKKRGVSVEIIVPGTKIDKKVVRIASRGKWGEMLEAGIFIYEYQPTMFHCKQMIVDDLWVSIGSSNLDNRSFRLNDEANLNVLDDRFAAEQIRVFQEDKTHAHQITYEQWKNRPLAEKISNHLASVLDGEI
jgi:cardiolipin synthase